MTDKRGKPPIREYEPSQKTGKELETPVPTQEGFFGALKKAVKKSPEKPSYPF